MATRLSSNNAAAEEAARSIAEMENRRGSPWLSSTAITIYLERFHQQYTNKRCIYSTCMWQKEFEKYHESQASPMYNMFFQGFRNRMDKRQHKAADNRDAAGHRFVIINVSESRAGSHWVLFGFDTEEPKTIYVWDSLGRGAGKTHANNLKYVNQQVVRQEDQWRCGFCALWNLQHVTAQHRLPLGRRHVHVGTPDWFILMVCDRLPHPFWH